MGLDTGFSSGINLSFDRYVKYSEESFLSQWKAALTETSIVYFLTAHDGRKVLEDDKFWAFFGKTIAESRKLDGLGFNSKIFNRKWKMFEREVLQQLPDNITIEIYDHEGKNKKNIYFIEWLQKYNITSFFSENITSLPFLGSAKNLKVLKFDFFPSCSENQLNHFLDLKKLHSLTIWFKKKVSMKKKVIDKFLDAVEKEELFPALIDFYFRNKKRYSVMMKRIEDLNKRKKNIEFVENALKRLDEDVDEGREEFLRKYLKDLFEVIKENGLLNEKMEFMIQEKVLKREFPESGKIYESVLEYGIQIGCLTRVEERNRMKVTLISETLDQQEQ